MERILHPATIVGTEDETHTAELEETDLPVVDGQDILIFYEKQREFTQQPARIQKVVDDERKRLIEFATTGATLFARPPRYTFRTPFTRPAPWLPGRSTGRRTCAA